MRKLVVAGAPLAESHAAEIADELRVRGVEFGDVAASELRVKPTLPVLGPKLGSALREIRAALAERGRPELARELDGAWISTIHGFCNRLLKAYPFAAGLTLVSTMLMFYYLKKKKWF